METVQFIRSVKIWQWALLGLGVIALGYFVLRDSSTKVVYSTLAFQAIALVQQNNEGKFDNTPCGEGEKTDCKDLSKEQRKGCDECKGYVMLYNNICGGKSIDNCLRRVVDLPETSGPDCDRTDITTCNPFISVFCNTKLGRNYRLQAIDARTRKIIATRTRGEQFLDEQAILNNNGGIITSLENIKTRENFIIRHPSSAIGDFSSCK